jgi:hypothetical protein
MSLEFELTRKEEKIEKLLQEQEKLNLRLPILRRDEQVDIERVRREYNLKIAQTQARLQGINKELEVEHRQIDRLRQQIEKEKEEESQEEKEGRGRRFRRF